MKQIFKSLFFIAVVALFFMSVGSVRAAVLGLTRISGTSVVGLDYSLVSYTGPMPIFEGTATPGARVLVTINSVATSSATATASGAWIFVPSALNVGANTILLTSGSENISFTIQYTPAPTATPALTPTVTGETPTVTTLPATGTIENTIVFMVAGISIFFVGWVAKKYFHYWEKH